MCFRASWIFDLIWSFTTNACTDNRIQCLCVCMRISFHFTFHIFTIQTHTCTHICIYITMKKKKKKNKAGWLWVVPMARLPKLFSSLSIWKKEIKIWIVSRSLGMVPSCWVDVVPAKYLLLLLYHLVKLISRLHHCHNSFSRWYKIPKLNPEYQNVHKFLVFLLIQCISQKNLSNRLEPIFRMSTPDCGPDFTN